MRPDQAWTLLRQMGPRWVAFRAAYSLRRRLGSLERRLPARPWSAYRLADLARGLRAEELRERLAPAGRRVFFFDPRGVRMLQEPLRRILDGGTRGQLEEEAAAVAQGRFPMFWGEPRDVGWPPAWHRHPLSGAAWPLAHWSRIGDSDASDVKWLWELGRFGFAYALVRAHGLTGDPRHAETFWSLVESWREANPPHQGVHWMCGQECAVRALAWCFALYAFLDASATTAERAAGLVEGLAVHGERIEGNLSFAVSQRNNHGISEALALWTLGTLFPFLHAARRWEATGRRLLETEARRQITDDGAYVQHSLNYHRLMLLSYAWALRLGDLQGRPFSPELRYRYGRAVELLHELTDEGSGGAPNYGSNDGSLLFHLDATPFADQRTALALGSWIAERRRLLPPGPWDETLLWMCGEEALEDPVRPRERRDLAAASGGYFTLHGRETWALLRCGTHRTRPAHADMLNVDVWWRGANVVGDPGTYSYNAEAPWNNGLRGTGVHNTVLVDGLDQMEPGPRFTWFGWTRSRLVRRSTDGPGRVKVLEGEHDGYLGRLGVAHRRALILVGDRMWIVLDDVVGPGRHEVSSQWLFPGGRSQGPADGMLRIRSAPGTCGVAFHSFGADGPPRVEVVSPSPDSPLGWFSPRYGSREPALGLVVSDAGPLPLRRLTLLALDPGGRVAVRDVAATRLVVEVESLVFEAEWAPLGGDPSRSVVVKAAIHGAGGTVDRA